MKKLNYVECHYNVNFYCCCDNCFPILVLLNQIRYNKSGYAVLGFVLGESSQRKSTHMDHLQCKWVYFGNIMYWFEDLKKDLLYLNFSSTEKTVNKYE